MDRFCEHCTAAARSAFAQTSPTASLLQELIRVDTSNPPGNEGKLDELLAPKFRALGFQVEIIPTPQAGKTVMFARLKGDGSAKPAVAHR